MYTLNKKDKTVVCSLSYKEFTRIIENLEYEEIPLEILEELFLDDPSEWLYSIRTMHVIERLLTETKNNEIISYILSLTEKHSFTSYTHYKVYLLRNTNVSEEIRMELLKDVIYKVDASGYLNWLTEKMFRYVYNIKKESVYFIRAVCNSESFQYLRKEDFEELLNMKMYFLLQYINDYDLLKKYFVTAKKEAKIYLFQNPNLKSSDIEFLYKRNKGLKNLVELLKDHPNTPNSLKLILR